MVADQFEVYLVPLDPAHGHEMRKTRPCVVITPALVNQAVQTVLIAPLTSVPRHYPFRVDCVFQGRVGQIALDQIRCVDRTRLGKHLGALERRFQIDVAETLTGMFGL